MELEILIIEDEQSIIDDWKEKIAFYSVEEERVYTIQATYTKSFAEAKRKLSSMKFHAAVVDIRLESERGKPNDDGNQIFEIITDTTLTVAAVYTGEPEIVSLQKHQEQFAKVFRKGDGDINEILSWFDERVTMISAINKVQSSFNIEMAKAFSRSIWPRWNHWVSEQVSDSASSSTVAALQRHMATHLHASFLLQDQHGAHPEEYFFIPPLQDSLDTGDIIYKDGNFDIIVTPRCDMVREKRDHSTYQLVRLEDMSIKWRELESKLGAADSPNKIKKAKSNILKFTNHDGQVGSHFIQRFRIQLPGDSGENFYGPYYAQFNQLRSIERNTTTTKDLLSHRVASLSNEFVPSLVERLGSYFSRIGTPDYSHPD